MAGFGFPGRYKLKKTDEFSSVFNFRKRIFGTLLAVHYKPNTLGHPRLGMVVGRKLSKRAVQRNYMKRVLRELFRHETVGLGAVDLLVRPLKAFQRHEFETVRQEYLALLARLQRRGER